MEVFVIPIGRDRYELYCEVSPEPPDEPLPTSGILSRLRHRFNAMLHAADERERAGSVHEPAATWVGRVQERIMAWVAERIAEQRLLWNLRRATASVVVHPHDMTFDQVQTLVRRTLKRDHDRHRLWLVVHSLLLVVSGLLALVPGPNLVAYYFAFRVVGHWFSMRGAAQGLHRITWSGQPSEPLTELRALSALDPGARQARLRDITGRLGLQRLDTYFERVAVRR
ncbi:MAG: hypothetical protein ABL993_01995 [Vicinamibacterales bacterium]